ncbi:MAG: hypothetical protein K6G56_04560 [Clostridiales bacterium]|nr:hypothetical protein [Clostridiales bacterium]
MDNDAKYSEEIEKVVNAVKKDCRLYGTPECRMLNPDGCQNCAVGEMKPEKQEETKNALSRLMQAAPPEALEPLYTGDECLFCKGESKGKKECYALFDLSKPDPEGDWTIALGKRKLGVKAADMILPLQVSCCKECQKRYRKFDYLPTLIALIVFALGLVLTTIGPVYKALFAVAPWLPLAVMIVFIVLALLTDALLKRLIGASMAKRMKTDVAELPVISDLMEKGWEEVAKKKQGVSALVFSNKFREHGVCSSMSGEPMGDDGSEPVICGIWPAEPDPEPVKEPDAPEEGGEDAPPERPVPEFDPKDGPELLGIIRQPPCDRPEKEEQENR